MGKRKTVQQLRDEAGREVEAWTHPMGTLVTVRMGAGGSRTTFTRSAPWILGETAVIMVEGIMGAYALEWVKPASGLRAVLAKPGEDPCTVHLAEGDGPEARKLQRDQVGQLLDAALVEWVRWGQGLLVAVDEDYRAKGLPLNLELHRQSQQGADLALFAVHGPALVVHHDDVGKTRGFSEENARTMMDLLRALQVVR